MNYKVDVNGANATLKQQFKTIGGARAALLALHNSKDSEFRLNTKFATYLQQSKKEQSKYEALKLSTRVTKKGNVNAYYLLQALYKLCK